MCLYDGEPIVDPDRSQLPFCGACLIVLMFVRHHGEDLWAGALPPDLSPNDSLELLRETSWNQVINTAGVAGANTWWFQQEKKVGK